MSWELLSCSCQSFTELRTSKTAFSVAQFNVCVSVLIRSNAPTASNRRHRRPYRGNGKATSFIHQSFICDGCLFPLSTSCRKNKLCEYHILHFPYPVSGIGESSPIPFCFTTWFGVGKVSRVKLKRQRVHCFLRLFGR